MLNEVEFTFHEIQQAVGLPEATTVYALKRIFGLPANLGKLNKYTFRKGKRSLINSDDAITIVMEFGYDFDKANLGSYFKKAVRNVLDVKQWENYVVPDLPEPEEEVIVEPEEPEEEEVIVDPEDESEEPKEEDIVEPEEPVVPEEDPLV